MSLSTIFPLPRVTVYLFGHLASAFSLFDVLFSSLGCLSGHWIHRIHLLFVSAGIWRGQGRIVFPFDVIFLFLFSMSMSMVFLGR